MLCAEAKEERRFDIKTRSVPLEIKLILAAGAPMSCTFQYINWRIIVIYNHVTGGALSMVH
jgi:hypothetical protein